MMIEVCPVGEVRTAGDGIFILRFRSPRIAKTIRAGQFLNIRASEGIDPLLRRPFSAYWTDKNDVEIVFHVVGRGTALLQGKRPGETIDVLGPAGTPFGKDNSPFDTAVLIGGGLGVAPLPILTRELAVAGTPVVSFLGGRSRGYIVRDHLENLQVATDDGSEGFHGTVVALAERSLTTTSFGRVKLFACGPMPMLRAVAVLARKNGMPCEVSLEGPMGCGIGICQGCPVELAGEEKKYALMCKEGPTFDIRTIRI